MKSTENYIKLNRALVLLNAVKNEHDELNFNYELNGVLVAIDIYIPDNSVYVYASDNVCYTFCKGYSNLSHAINGLNLWLKNASYKK